jgi:hypothetical protein
MPAMIFSWRRGVRQDYPYLYSYLKETRTYAVMEEVKTDQLLPV